MISFQLPNPVNHSMSFTAEGHIGSQIIEKDDLNNIKSVEVSMTELDWVLSVFPYLKDSLAYNPDAPESFQRIQVWYGDIAKVIGHYWLHEYNKRVANRL